MPQTRLTPAQAAAVILESIAPLPIEQVPLLETPGRVLGEEIVSPLDLPPWDNSAMDGYAVRSEDVEAAVELRIVEEIQAGAFPTKAIGPGECARIFTGAPIPEGADGVIRQEHTTRLDDDRVRIDDVHDAGRNVRRRGEDIRRGETVFRHGTPVGSAEVGVLAALAAGDVAVHRRPNVALFACGDELVPLSERDAILSGRKLASSNSYTMMAMAAEAGAAPTDLGIAQDDPDELRERIIRAAGADLLVTSAGMSVGEHDYLRSILEERGLDMKFWRVRMRPGAPVGFGLLDGLPWIGLPGNPVSTMVTFELLVRPAIRKMLGYGRLFRATVTVEVGDPILLHAKLQYFLRVRLEEGDGLARAHLTGPQGSGMLSSMAKADALLIVPEGKTEVSVGETLRAIRLDESRHVVEVPF